MEIMTGGDSVQFFVKAKPFLFVQVLLFIAWISASTIWAIMLLWFGGLLKGLFTGIAFTIASIFIWGIIVVGIIMIWMQFQRNLMFMVLTAYAQMAAGYQQNKVMPAGQVTTALAAIKQRFGSLSGLLDLSQMVTDQLKKVAGTSNLLGRALTALGVGQRSLLLSILGYAGSFSNEETRSKVKTCVDKVCREGEKYASSVRSYETIGLAGLGLMVIVAIVFGEYISMWLPASYWVVGYLISILAAFAAYQIIIMNYILVLSIQQGTEFFTGQSQAQSQPVQVQIQQMQQSKPIPQTVQFTAAEEMLIQRLSAYARSVRSQGYNDESIKMALSQNGQNLRLIEEALKRI